MGKYGDKKRKFKSRYKELTEKYGEYMAFCIANGYENEDDIIEQEVKQLEELEEYIDMDNYAAEHEESMGNLGIRYTVTPDGTVRGELVDLDECVDADATEMPEVDDSFTELQRRIEPIHESVIRLTNEVALSRYLLRGKNCEYEPVYHKIVDGKLACTTKRVLHDFVIVPEEAIAPMRVTYRGRQTKICRCKECFK